MSTRNTKRPIPEKGDPIVRAFLRLAGAQGFPMRAVERWAGVTASAMRKWRGGANANLSTIKAALNAIDYDLVIIHTATGEIVGPLEEDGMEFGGRSK